jgi:hypothetical protein
MAERFVLDHETGIFTPRTRSQFMTNLF